MAYFGMQKLLAKLKITRLEGISIRFLEKLAKTDFLIIDDLSMGLMDHQQQLDFMEITEDNPQINHLKQPITTCKLV